MSETQAGDTAQYIADLEAERDALRTALDSDKAGMYAAGLTLANEVERLKLSMLAHFNEEHLAGDGPEIDRWKRKVERLRAALEEIRGLTKCASDVVIIRLSSIAAQALYPDWRNGGVAPEVKP